MTLYLLDTNHCSRVIENDPDVLRAAQATRPPIDEVVTTVTVTGELFFMVEASDRLAVNRARVEGLLERLRLLDLDALVGERYGALKARLFAHFAPRSSKRAHKRLADIGISENDAWIAAAALRWGATVVSADNDFARIREAVPELALVSWWTPPSSAPTRERNDDNHS